MEVEGGTLSQLNAPLDPRDAMAIYLFMGDGDPSLDAAYLAMRFGGCCALLGGPHATKRWYGRAGEENPEIPAYAQARQRCLLLPPD
jgi:hypothetical protein